jgi:N-carbamoyl-L-amino-acid hydrolase
LFVPNLNGVSHHWTEDTSQADIVLDRQALADAAEEIAGEGDLP